MSNGDDGDQGDLTVYTGRKPYAAHLVGTYQPLLGWRSRTYQRRIKVEVERLLHAQVLTAVGTSIATHQRANRPASNATLGSGRLAATELARRLSSLPAVLAGSESSSDQNGAPDHRSAAFDQVTSRLSSHSLFTSYIAGTAAEDHEPSEDLAPSYLELLQTVTDSVLSLSPVGLLHVYQQYYFDLGTQLSPPVEHVWIAPYGSLEMLETYSRSEVRFRERQDFFEADETTDTEQTETNDISEEFQTETQRDLRTSFSAEGGASFAVWEARASASLDYGTSVREGKRTATQNSRTTSTRATSRIRRGRTTTARTTTSIETGSSRRHTITNPTGQVISFELRRKLQRVGVQVKHLGTQLCWQLAVNNPGLPLGLGELIHVARPDDFNNSSPPDAPPTFPNERTDFIFNVPFQAVDDADGDSKADSNELYNVSEEGGRQIAVNSPNDRINAKFRFVASPPTPGYCLKNVRETSVDITDPSHDQPSTWVVEYTVIDEKSAEFEATLVQVNFEKQPSVRVTAELVWKVDPTIAQAAEESWQTEMEQHSIQLQREAKAAIAEQTRERVRSARSVIPRAADALRSEERAVVYRRIVQELYGSEVPADLPLFAAQIRSLFDIDRLMYFVAPDWWQPRAIGSTPAIAPAEGEAIARPPTQLSTEDQVPFEGPGARRPQNYAITEDSRPAPLGSSLGWTVQLDGDDHRNAFLNSPWVTAVVPIAPGRERQAIEWLKSTSVEGADGLEAQYAEASDSASAEDEANEAPEDTGTSDDAGEGPTVEDKLLELVDNLRNEPTNVDHVLRSEQVFQTGFNPLGNGFKLDEEPLEVFAQWTETIPTRQVVPVAYSPDGSPPAWVQGGSGDDPPGAESGAEDGTES